jgi:hypothetical protein
MEKIVFVLMFIFAAFFCNAQSEGKKPESYQFKDTIYSFVFDSLNSDLGEVEPANINNRMVKHFIYLGEKPTFITGQKSGDPHFICEYPKEPIVRGKVYSFTVCFWFQNGKGSFNKLMMLELDDGKFITFKFKGVYRTL